MGPTDVYRGLEWEGGHFARTCLESRPQSDDNVMRQGAEATRSPLSPIFVVLVLTTVGAVAMCVESKRARAGSPTAIHSPPIHLAPIIPKRLSRRPYHSPAFKLRKRGWTRPTSLETWPRARRHRQAARDGPTSTPHSSSPYSGQHISGRESSLICGRCAAPLTAAQLPVMRILPSVSPFGATSSPRTRRPYSTSSLAALNRLSRCACIHFLTRHLVVLTVRRLGVGELRGVVQEVQREREP